MDTFYSVSLLAALILGGLGSALFLVVALMRNQPGRLSGLRTPLWFFGIGSSGAAALSVFVHAIFGHGASSAEPMNAPQFIDNHRAYLVVIALSCLTWLGVYLAAKWSNPTIHPGAGKP